MTRLRDRLEGLQMLQVEHRVWFSIRAYGHMFVPPLVKSTCEVKL